MNNIKKIILLPLIASLLVLQGCTGMPVQFNTSKDIDYSLYDMENPKKHTVTMSGLQLLLFIPIRVNNRQARAYAELEKLADDGLIGEVRIKETWKYVFIGTRYITTLEADIYPKKL